MVIFLSMYIPHYGYTTPITVIFYFFISFVTLCMPSEYYTPISMSWNWIPGLCTIFYIVLYEILYIFKTSFAFLEIKFLNIQLIIPYALGIIDKIWLSSLNVSSKPFYCRYSSFTFLTSQLLKLYSTLMFLDPIFSILHFCISNLNFLNIFPTWQFIQIHLCCFFW